MFTDNYWKSCLKNANNRDQKFFYTYMPNSIACFLTHFNLLKLQMSAEQLKHFLFWIKLKSDISSVEFLLHR